MFVSAGGVSGVRIYQSPGGVGGVDGVTQYNDSSFRHTWVLHQPPYTGSVLGGGDIAEAFLFIAMTGSAIFLGFLSMIISWQEML